MKLPTASLAVYLRRQLIANEDAPRLKPHRDISIAMELNRL